MCSLSLPLCLSYLNRKKKKKFDKDARRGHRDSHIVTVPVRHTEPRKQLRTQPNTCKNSNTCYGEGHRKRTIAGKARNKKNTASSASIAFFKS